MNCRTAAVAVLLCLSPISVHAQTPVFHVTAVSANVHKAPSTGSPVLGYALRGASLEVTRELGSWVKVVWAKAADGVGYIHVSGGSIARPAIADQRPATTSAPVAAGTSPRSPAPPAPPAAARVETVAPVGRRYVRTPSHTLGFGGRAGAPDLGIGAAARAWSDQRFGVQLEVSRLALGDEPARFTSIQFAPSVMFALRDRVTENLWLRPYVGAGPTMQHQTFGGLLPDERSTATRFGFQAFGGGEVTLASLPQLAVSADVGYRRQPTSFAGVDPAGIGVVVSAHWYFR